MSTVECLRMQLDEICAVSSIFSGQGEVQVDDDALNSVRQYIAANGSIPETPKPLDIFFHLENVGKIGEMEIQVELPINYPLLTPPSMLVRCKTLSGNQLSVLNTALREQAAKVFSQCPVLYDILLWLDENAQFILETASVGQAVVKDEFSNEHRPIDNLGRFWIYSHHIYNKEKRKGILATSKEFDLSGFCLPGRPGIICVEGMRSDCQRFWERIRSWTWKRILLKHQELAAVEADIALEAQLAAFRKFNGFAEVAFISHNGRGREVHMNLGDFYAFLVERNCAHIFPMYFGVQDSTE
ncbi:hypothetical protein D918_00716 [Trichuris suis]|nr:hypothetical protein D918_00716 [Trichuris suis]